MKKSSVKLVIMLIIFALLISIVQLSVYATNENVEIVKKSDAEYLIYVKGNLDTDFKFAFSNDKDTNPENLIYVNAAFDSTESDANKIAYVDSSTIALFSADTYMWAKSASDYIIKGIKIDLSDSILDSELTSVDSIAKRIKVDLTQVTQKKEIINETEHITTLGKVVILEDGNYTYQMVKATSSEDYVNFMKLAEKISKSSSIPSYYDKLQAYGDFYNLYEKLKGQLPTEAWARVENNEILQPEDANDGEEYVLWINDEENKLVDVQFLSSKKEMSQEKAIEKITTKLPVTYDNNTLLIVLGILVVITGFVSIRIIMIKKSEQE